MSLALPTIWHVPYARNPFFTGCEDLLAQLHMRFQAGQAQALSQPLAMSGPGGIGKTQLAVEYAYQHRQDYQTVLWAQAENAETKASAFTTIATLLQLPEHHANEQEIIVRAVKTWLQVQDDWLLIFDNADDLTLLPAFLPLLWWSSTANDPRQSQGDWLPVWK